MNLLAHANGTGWDEVLLAAAPFLLSFAVFFNAKRRLRLASIPPNIGAGRRAK